MKQFYVMLTYMSLKAPQKVLVMTINADDARKTALEQHPNAKIEGPGAVYEAKQGPSAVGII